jgi:hypothetical protein
VNGLKPVCRYLLDYLPRNGLELPLDVIDTILGENPDLHAKSQRLVDSVHRLAKLENSPRAYECLMRAILDFCDERRIAARYDTLRHLVEFTEIRVVLNNDSDGDLSLAPGDQPEPGVERPVVLPGHSNPLFMHALNELYKMCWFMASDPDQVGFHSRQSSFLSSLATSSCSEKVLVQHILGVDALCTHVPIAEKIVPAEDVIHLLRDAMEMCYEVRYKIAVYLRLRLLRRIACIYFRQSQLKEAREVIDEAKYEESNCRDADVGRADFHWLLAWITFSEILDSGDCMQRLQKEWGTIHKSIHRALDIACQLPDITLQKAYTSRIACNAACLHLQMADIVENNVTCLGEQLTASNLRSKAREFREENITKGEMAKRDSHLVSDVDDWLSNTLTVSKTRDVSNNVFVERSKWFQCMKGL